MRKITHPYWQPLIDHIYTGWMRKKNGLQYPFRAAEMKQLKLATRNYPEWQLMALWDEFINSENDWIKKTGYSINGFLGCIVWLVDAPGWKARAREYEEKIAPLPKEISEIIRK